MKKNTIYVSVVLLLLVLYVVFGLIGVYKTENGIVFGLPDYEKRDIHVSQVDLAILIKANEILSSENKWSKKSVSNCLAAEKIDLYCALEKASIAIMGKYIHRQPALQEVRFVVDDHYRARWKKHRLIDFNGNKDTAFEDIKSVLGQAIAAVKKKLVTYEAHSE